MLGEQISKKKIKAGDLLVFGNQYFLALGETIVFSEHYQNLATVQAELVYKKFLTLPTLKLFHWMVETYYTTYKSVVRLFVARDIEKLLQREDKVLGKKWKVKGNVWQSLSSFICPFPVADQWQTLIVFPDLRTMANQSRDIETLRHKNIQNGVALLLSGDTENQKDVHRWEIKTWIDSVIVCTYAEIFQDFKNLQKIIFVDPHKRYYASQQDPRYKVGEVIEKMKELCGAEVEIIEV